MNPAYSNEQVSIPADGTNLPGNIAIPNNARGLVIFSHGSGSSRHSPRNKQVAQYLQNLGLATLLFDLLTPEEDQDYEMRFNIPLLSDRLAEVTDWAMKEPAIKNFLIGYFGASTGAASALIAASRIKQIRAVVSRGGRPDLALPVLDKVEAPTLFIVGSLDTEVLELNRQALEALTCEKKLEIVPGATHLFEEPGKMDAVCAHTGAWFQKYLS